MQTEGASLSRVAVVFVPDSGGRTEVGQPLNPADFWSR